MNLIPPPIVDIPNNMLSVDGNTPPRQIRFSSKNGFLYDRLNHTDKFYDEVKVDVGFFSNTSLLLYRSTSLRGCD